MVCMKEVKWAILGLKWYMKISLMVFPKQKYYFGPNNGLNS